MLEYTNKLIVSTKDGRGVFSPFAPWDKHYGESFWVDNRKFRIGNDNRVQIPKTFMKAIAEKAGVVRADGRYAVAMQMSAFGERIETDKGYKTIRSYGGVVVPPNDKLKPYLENGKNEQLIPGELMKVSGDGEDKRLLVMDYTEPYPLYKNVRK